MKIAGVSRLNVKDNNDGTYVCVFTCAVAGCNTAMVTLDGHHIVGSPFTINVSPDIAVASRTTVTGQVFYATASQLIVIGAEDRFCCR